MASPPPTHPISILKSTINSSCIMIHHSKCITTNDRLGYINYSYRMFNIIAHCKTSTILIKMSMV